MRQMNFLTIAACLIATSMFHLENVFAQDVELKIELRSMELPMLGPEEQCLISKGTRGTVPRQKHIFGGELWFGTGPVYFALAWKASADDNAIFSLEPVPYNGSAYRAKTPWVSVPTYSGPVVIRGHSLTESSKALRFYRKDSKDRLKLNAPNAPSSSLW